MEVFYVVCCLGGSAAVDAVFGYIPGERGCDLNPWSPDGLREVGATPKRPHDKGGSGWRRVLMDYFTEAVSVLV